MANSGVAGPAIYSLNANFKLSSLFISLEIDCFFSHEHENSCMGGLINRRAGYTTDGKTIVLLSLKFFCVISNRFSATCRSERMRIVSDLISGVSCSKAG